MSQMIRPPFDPFADDPGPFRRGWKEVYRERPDGTHELAQLPLTREDVLHPEENYKIMNGSRHSEECRYLVDVITARLSGRQDTLVLGDTGVYWDVKELGHHSPDVSVIFGIREPRDQWPSFHVAEEGVRPVLLIENVSPSTRDVDLEDKVKEYHQAGVPWYVIIDRIQAEGPPTFIGYRHTQANWVEFLPDEQGRLLLKPLALKLGVRGNRVALFDAATSEELGDYEAVCETLRAEREARELAERERDAAIQRADENRQKAELERQRAELERQKAELERQRAELERQRAEEANMRVAAAEAARRQDAERAQVAEAAHAGLVQRMQQMEADLRRLQGDADRPSP